MVETAMTDQAAPKPSTSDDPPSGLIKTKTAVWEKPTKTVKLSYAFPYLAVAAIAAPMTIELKIFYTDTVLVPAGLLALATAIARAFDAITDPVMGWISDRTRTRWGRRKPYILPGALGSALFLWLMFAPPESLDPHRGGAIWAGATFCLYYLFHTIWNVPYAALGLELTPDYDDRTSVFGWRAIAGGLGVVLSFLALYYIKLNNVFPDEREMLSVFVGTLCILMIIFFIIPVFKIKENQDFSTRRNVPLIPGIRAALRNHPFKVLITVYIMMSVTATLPPLLMPYFSKYIIQLEGIYRVIFGLIYVIATLVSLPVWMFVARVLGKLHVWVIAASTGIVTSAILFFIEPGQVVLMGIMEAFRGFAAGSVMIVGPAMLADIIDYDELHTGKRREAQFASFMAIVPKFVAIFSATIPLAVLGMVGYNPVLPSQAPQTLFAIRGLYALLPVAFHIIILIIILKYPISREVHGLIRKGIDDLARGDKTTDPISGKTLVPLKPEDEDTTWFLDNFSIKELKKIAANGPLGLVSGVFRDVIVWAFVLVSSVVFTVGMLHDSLSSSAADQLKQGVGACLVVVAGLALTLMVFHIFRVQAAKKMAAQPVKADTIRNHIVNL
ncbi:MAG: MFS transporter [Proteobacteria bacterium]|nr:MFS transporter [Pseudomonadota bacterium]MBU4470514.1 MFS transporter [Pseudomonadota bacterium]MCG2751350.1 MFS transporter [Desulfobacteraceae bacterium]